MTDRPDAPATVPAPTWLVWTNRAVLTLAGVVGAVMVNDYASMSGEALDLALAAAILVATAVAVALPTHPTPVLLASLLAMLGLALVPPLWLLALLAPLLLWTHRRRARRAAGRGGAPAPGPDDPRGTP